MANVYRIEQRGNGLQVLWDDGFRALAVRTAGRAFLVPPRENDDPDPGPGPGPGPGPLPDSLTITRNDNGETFTLEKFQLEYLATILRVVVDLGQGKEAFIVNAITVIVESHVRNLASVNVPGSTDYPHDGVGSDRDSIGLYQQRPVSGWGSVHEIMPSIEYQARAFMGGPTGPNYPSPPGLLDISGWENMTPGQAAQAVQVSAFPDKYDLWTNAANDIYNAIANASSGNWQWPFKPFPYTEGGDMPAPGSQDAIWAEYGPRSGIGVGGFHEGMDFGYGTALNGAEIPCAGDGTVYSASLDGGYGNRVRVDHPDGTSTSYCHIQNGGFRVGPGDKVTAGQIVGIIGGTGGVAPHLHFETHETPAADQVPNTANNGAYRSAVNPRDYMGSRVSG